MSVRRFYPTRGLTEAMRAFNPTSRSQILKRPLMCMCRLSTAIEYPHRIECAALE